MGSVLYIVILSSVLQESPGPTIEDQTYGSLLARARAEYLVGSFAQSEALFISALRILPRADETTRASVLSELGDLYVNEDKLGKAETVYRESLAIYKKTPDKAKVALLLRHLGALYSLQRRDDEAQRVLNEALKITRADLQTDKRLIAEIVNSLGVLYYRQGNMSKAEKFFLEAVQLLPAPDGLFGKADLLNNLGTVYYAKGYFDKAEKYLTRALKLTEGQVGPAHPDLTFSLSTLGVLYTDMGKYAEAEAQYQRALAILDSNPLVFETRIARLLHALSGTYTKAGRRVEADATLSRATTIARRNLAEHPDMAMIMEAYATALKNSGKPKEAEELRVEARRARMAAGLVVNAHSPF
jgi:tetratricopeptide (TPR) repeat protein